MPLDLTGRIVHRLPVFSGTSARGNWSKQEFIVETLDTYPRKVCVSLFGEDKIKELDAFADGEVVKISFNLESREYNNRWYTEVRAWRIVKDTPTTPGHTDMPPAPPMPTTPPPTLSMTDDDGADDLPF